MTVNWSQILMFRAHHYIHVTSLAYKASTAFVSRLFI